MGGDDERINLLRGLMSVSLSSFSGSMVKTLIHINLIAGLRAIPISLTAAVP